MREFMNIAHRGASGEAPENTMAAFNYAMEMGCKWLECDLRLTADNQVVVIHDRTLDRTTNGSGAVRGFTLTQIQSLDAGSWFGPAYRGETVPSLAELLDNLSANTHLVLEIKDGIFFPRIIEETISQITSRGLKSKVSISAFHPEVLERVGELCSQLSTQLLVDYGKDGTPKPVVDGKEIEVYSSTQRLAQAASSVGAKVICPPASAICSRLVSSLHERGFLVRAWGLTDNCHGEMLRLIRCGIDGMTTNYPDQLKRIWLSWKEDPFFSEKCRKNV